MINISEKNRLLKLRSAKNKKRPKFIRSEWHRLKRLQTSWRSPKGIDSKMRRKFKGKRKSPSSGYRNPKLVRGLHSSGKELVRVQNIYDLEEIVSDTQIAQIGSGVGTRKRIAIINLAEELEIHIVNPQIRREIDEGFDDDVDDEIEFEEDTLDDDDEVLLDEEDVDDDNVDDEDVDDEVEEVN